MRSHRITPLVVLSFFIALELIEQNTLSMEWYRIATAKVEFASLEGQQYIPVRCCDSDIAKQYFRVLILQLSSQVGHIISL